MARRLKRDTKEVSRKRQVLGILSAKPMRPWAPQAIKWLGRKSDAEVARRIGRRSATGAFQRRKLGLAAFGPSKRGWTTSEEKLLGTVSDSRLAKRLKRSLAAVRLRRAQLRIAMFGQKRFRPRRSGRRVK